jgi:hypothetical protein
MSKITKILAISFIFLFVVTVTAGAVSAIGNQPSDPSIGLNLHSAPSLQIPNPNPVFPPRPLPPPQYNM